MEENSLISLKEIMKLLDICESSARNLIKQEGFPAIPIGRAKYLIPRDAFMAWFTNPDRLVQFREKCNANTTK